MTDLRSRERKLRFAESGGGVVCLYMGERERELVVGAVVLLGKGDELANVCIVCERESAGSPSSTALGNLTHKVRSNG